MNKEDKYHPFTKEEFQHILVQAVKGAGEQTTEEVQKVLNEAINIKVGSLLLDEVMKENLFMFWCRDKNEVVFDVANKDNSND
jgi:hypothetical protein